MDKYNISDIVFKLYLYADATKMIHYTTDSMHAHELCDTVRDTIIDFADELAEQSFGYYGKPDFSRMTKLNSLEIKETDDLGELCKNATDKGKMSKNIFLCSFDKISNYNYQN